MKSINEFVAIFYNKSQNQENYQKANSLQFLNRIEDRSTTIFENYESVTSFDCENNCNFSDINNNNNNFVDNMNVYKKSIKKIIESKPISKSSYSEQDLFKTASSKTGKSFLWNSFRFQSSSSNKKPKLNGKILNRCQFLCYVRRFFKRINRFQILNLLY